MEYKQFIIISYVCILIGFLLDGCSDLRNPVPVNSPATLSVHPEGWITVGSPEFHGEFFKTINWDLGHCQQCHGTDYKGGIANSSCLTCHPTTPEDCTTCHGGVDNQTGAPPEDLLGNRTSDAPGVGAHTSHLNGVSLSTGFVCETCHVVPDSFNDPGHVDSNLPAEVLFSNLAVIDGANPVWDGSADRCSNSFCHGSWRLAKAESNFPNIYIADEMKGNEASPKWTDPGTAVCGTCHILPPAGHAPAELNQCSVCHKSVVDARGNIIDKTKHVNGQVNVFGDEYPIF